MVARACNPSYSGGLGRRTAWTQEAEVAIAPLHSSLGNKSETPSQKKVYMCVCVYVYICVCICTYIYICKLLYVKCTLVWPKVVGYVEVEDVQVIGRFRLSDGQLVEWVKLLSKVLESIEKNVWIKRRHCGLGTVAYTCNPSSLVGQDGYITWGQESETSLTKRAKFCL